MKSLREITLRESNPLDSSALNDFFSDIQTEGKLNIKIRRQIDFFSFYHRLNLKFKNFIFESTKNNDGVSEAKPEVLGTATFLFQHRLLFNQVVKIALACDLRISPKRRAILNWSHFFLPKISDLQIQEKIDHFVTSINLTESKAINAFLRPRQFHTNLPIYELIHKYNLVSIHGFFPLRYQLHKNITTGYATENDKNQIIEFIKSKLKNYDFIPEELLSDFENYISKSIIYSFSRFIIAKDLKGNIIGCTHPISSGILQDYFPQKYDHQANNFRQFLKFASLLGFARRLTRPFSSTNKEQTLNFRILHFLFFDHPEVLKSLIHFSYKDSRYNEFLIYAYQPNQYEYRPPHGSLYSETPYGLFEIKKSDAPSYQSKIKISKNIFLDYLWF